MVANDVIPDSYKHGYGVNKKKVKSSFFRVEKGDKKVCEMGM